MKARPQFMSLTNSGCCHEVFKVLKHTVDQSHCVAVWQICTNTEGQMNHVCASRI